MQYNYYQYCEQMANRHYPKIYRVLVQHVIYVCDRYDQNADMYPFPSDERIEEMTDMVMERYERDNNRSIEEEDELTRQYGRRFVRDLGVILLLQRLLGRRRRRYGYPGYGYPGYGYPGYFGY
jgi:hypothetical protein